MANGFHLFQNPWLGLVYLSTVLEDFSRHIIAWKLLNSMTASDVKETLDEAVSNTGVNQIQVKHRPRLLSDNGPCYIAGELKNYLEKQGMTHTRGAPYHPMTQTLSSVYEEYRQTSELLLPLGTGTGTLTIRRLLQQPSIPRILKQRDSD